MALILRFRERRPMTEVVKRVRGVRPSGTTQQNIKCEYFTHFVVPASVNDALCRLYFAC